MDDFQKISANVVYTIVLGYCASELWWVVLKYLFVFPYVYFQEPVPGATCIYKGPVLGHWNQAIV